MKGGGKVQVAWSKEKCHMVDDLEREEMHDAVVINIQ